MSHNAQEILTRVFPQLDQAAIERLTGAARVADYPGAVRLCEQGKPGDTFYILVNGAVNIMMHTDTGTRLVDTLGPGSFFGELALIRDRPRIADVVTVDDVTVIEIGRDAFNRDIRPDVALYSEINRLIIEKLVAQEEKLLARLPAPQYIDKEPQQVFLSYARADMEFAQRLTRDLRARGFNIWVDQARISAGATWWREIEKAMEVSAVMLLVLTPESVESRYVANEWNYFLDEEKPIVPVVAEPCRVPYPLRQLQRISFVASESYERALDRLFDALCVHVC